MKSYARDRRWIDGAALGAVVLLLAAAASGQDATAPMPIENLRLPLEHYEDGSVKTQIRAGFALVPPQGMIVASNVVVEMFFPDGTVDVKIEADECRFDRKEQTVDSTSRVRIERGGVVITGTGFSWSGKKERVKITSKAQVAFQRDLGRTGGPLKSRLKRSGSRP